MWTALDSLRNLSISGVLLRLTLAMFFGGMIGLDRERKRRPAGLRTYMLVCIGAALAVVLGQYEATMLATQWADAAAKTGAKADVARLGAQVINGIGFLGAGTIIVTNRQEVKGLTTAAGLWASACMGLAIGAGFYECVVVGFVLIFLCIRILPYFENKMIEHARNMNLYVEFLSIEDLGKIILRIKELGIQIYDVELSRGSEEKVRHPNALFMLRLNSGQVHARVMADLSGLSCVWSVDEV